MPWRRHTRRSADGGRDPARHRHLRAVQVRGLRQGLRDQRRARRRRPRHPPAASSSSCSARAAPARRRCCASSPGWSGPTPATCSCPAAARPCTRSPASSRPCGCSATSRIGQRGGRHEADAAARVRWTRSTSPTRRRRGRPPCRAARPSGSPWPGPWSASPSCCCSTSRSPPSTPSPGCTCRTSSATCSPCHQPAVLLVTHDVDEAIRLADRVLVLREGRFAVDLRIDAPHPRDRTDVAVPRAPAPPARRARRHRARRAARRPHHHPVPMRNCRCTPDHPAERPGPRPDLVHPLPGAHGQRPGPPPRLVDRGPRRRRPRRRHPAGRPAASCPPPLRPPARRACSARAATCRRWPPGPRARPARLVGLTWIDEWQTILVRPDSGITRRRRPGRRPRRPAGLGRAPGAPASRGDGPARHRPRPRPRRAHASSDIRFVEIPTTATAGSPLGPASAPTALFGIDALLAGDVDAVYVKGARRPSGAAEHGLRVWPSTSTPTPTSGNRVNNGTPRPITVHQRILDERPELVVRFLVETLRAADWAADDLDEVRDPAGRDVSGRRGRRGRLPRRLPPLAAPRPLRRAGRAVRACRSDFLLAHGFLAARLRPRRLGRPGPLAEAAGRLLALTGRAA